MKKSEKIKSKDVKNAVKSMENLHKIVPKLQILITSEFIKLHVDSEMKLENIDIYLRQVIEEISCLKIEEFPELKNRLQAIIALSKEKFSEVMEAIEQMKLDQD